MNFQPSEKVPVRKPETWKIITTASTVIKIENRRNLQVSKSKERLVHPWNEHRVLEKGATMEERTFGHWTVREGIESLMEGMESRENRGRSKNKKRVGGVERAMGNQRLGPPPEPDHAQVWGEGLCFEILSPGQWEPLRKSRKGIGPGYLALSEVRWSRSPLYIIFSQIMENSRSREKNDIHWLIFKKWITFSSQLISGKNRCQLVPLNAHYSLLWKGYNWNKTRLTWSQDREGCN